jgi:hypothetical protein
VGLAMRNVRWMPVGEVVSIAWAVLIVGGLLAWAGWSLWHMPADGWAGLGFLAAVFLGIAVVHAIGIWTDRVAGIWGLIFLLLAMGSKDREATIICVVLGVGCLCYEAWGKPDSDRGR